MHIFYCEQIEAAELVLNEEESHHLTKVLRLKEGAEIVLINGQGAKRKAVINFADARKSMIETAEWLAQEKSRDWGLHLFMAPTKNIDRTEWMLEKSVELGIRRITFVETKRTERSRLNMERLHKIALSAAKQSGELWLPRLDELTPITQAMSLLSDNESSFIAHCRTGMEESITSKLERGKFFSVFIGPEGDFTEDEIALALSNNLQEVSLGKNRLRTETAALFVTFATYYLNQ
jgi:16S rRNA (uracil1498-N3)-methyltransferase